MSVAAVGDALVQKTVMLGDPEDRLSALASGPAVAPDVALAFVSVDVLDTACIDDAISLLYNWNSSKSMGVILAGQKTDDGSLDLTVVVAWSGDLPHQYQAWYSWGFLLPCSPANGPETQGQRQEKVEGQPTARQPLYSVACV